MVQLFLIFMIHISAAQLVVSAKTETQGPKQRSLQLDPGV